MAAKTAAQHAELAARHPNRVIAIIALSYLMLIADTSIVVTALPRIREGLGFSAVDLSWVTNSYSLAFGGLLLLGARAGDILGRRRMFVVGLALFTATSLLVGLSPSSGWLIAARMLQGAAGAVIAPSTLALLSTSFPVDPMRGRALAIYGSITGIGTSVGLVLGGIITNLFSWRWAFIINVPVGVVLLFTATRHLHETERHAGRFDLGGALASTFGMTSLVYGLVRSADFGWRDHLTQSALALGTGLLVALVLHERDADQPIMPLRLFASRQRSGANLARLLFVGNMMGFWFFMSQYLQDARGMNPMATGLAFLPMTLASFAIAFLVPRLSRRWGHAPLLMGGLAAVLVGMVWLSRSDASAPYLGSVALPMMLVGFGQGASTIRLTTAGIANVEPRDAGAASGIVSTAVQLGNALGLSVLVVLTAHIAQSAYGRAAFVVERTHVAMLGGVGFMVLALLAAVWTLSDREH